MALAQDFSVFVPEIWSPRVTEFFKARLHAARFFTDLSSEVANGGDTIHLPKIGDNFTVASVNTTSGNVTSENIQDTSVTLTINNWKATALSLSDFQLAQVLRSYNIRARYARNMAYTLARHFDKTLLEEGKNLDTELGDSATDLTTTNTELALEILDSNSVPKDGLVYIFHPRTYWGDVFKKSRYVDASQFGDASLPSGVLGTLGGIPVVVSEQIPDTHGSLANLLVHPEAFVYAFGNLPGGTNQGVRLQEKALVGGHLRRKIIADIAFGIKTLRPEAGVVLAAKNNR